MREFQCKTDQCDFTRHFKDQVNVKCLVGQTDSSAFEIMSAQKKYLCMHAWGRIGRSRGKRGVVQGGRGGGGGGGGDGEREKWNNLDGHGVCVGGGGGG